MTAAQAGAAPAAGGPDATAGPPAPAAGTPAPAAGTPAPAAGTPAPAAGTPAPATGKLDLATGKPAGTGDTTTTETLVAGSGGYEVLKNRLAAQGEALRAKAERLNAARLAAFGRSEQALLLRTRARTANNCVARDIVRIGDTLLFGYNVFIGLRKETAVGDVFGLYRLARPEAARDGPGSAAPAPSATDPGAGELEPVPLAGSFLEESRFAADFRELYAYYKQAQLVQLRVTHDKLLAAFRIGQQAHDLRVFRWRLEADGSPHYIDNRGERDIAPPPSHDFEWTPTGREDHVGGRHPHVNVLDTVFVETIGGDLTIKVENNTETGLGIYSEPVEDRTQALADAEVAHARLGALILLRVRPYREQATRYLVFNARTQQVVRIDAIGSSCVQLPEDHGIVFPGGYYLQSGEFKHFDLPGEVVENLRFLRMLRSPNGEDVLYVFYQPDNGHYALFTYNLIEKTLAAPIVANGYAVFDDGRVLVFQAGRDEPGRLHPMQLWRTPFASEDHAAATPPAPGLFGRIGNAELVRGISELMAVARAVRDQAPTRAAYDDLIRQCERLADACFWLAEDEAGGLLQDLKTIADGARATLAEFEKVDQIRRETARALNEAQDRQQQLLGEIAATLWRRPEQFIEAIASLRERRGALEMLKELRFADLARIASLDQSLVEEQQRVGERALQFLAQEQAFDPHRQALAKLAAEVPQAHTTTALQAILQQLDDTAGGLDLLTEQLAGLPGSDAVLRTTILDRISALYTDINKLRADARARRRSLGASEAAAEFGAQFKLFGQAVENALEFADTPQKCDDALTRLLAQLEELEGRFAEQESFAADIAAKRESVYEALAARKQVLVQARQQRVRGLVEAAGRILEGAARRTQQFDSAEAVHSYYAADVLIAKLRRMIAEARELGAGVQADELETRLKTSRDVALRAVRDQRELMAGGGDTLQLGRHAFTVQRQPLDLTLVPAEGGLAFHLTGTDYLVPLREPRLEALRACWQQALPSETVELARAEYLAGRLLAQALEQGAAALDALAQQEPETLLGTVRAFAAEHYQHGYDKGIHDEDAARILRALLGMQQAAGLLAWGPAERALALLYWQDGRFGAEREALQRRARSAVQVRELFDDHGPLRQLEAECAAALQKFAASLGDDFASSATNGAAASAAPSAGAPVRADDPPSARADDPPSFPRRRESKAPAFPPRAAGPASDNDPLPTLCARSAAYLVQEIADGNGPEVWCIGGAGADLAASLTRELQRRGRLESFQHDLEQGPLAERWRLARSWAQAYARAAEPAALPWVDDAATALAVPVQRERINAALDAQVEGLRSEHPRIREGRLALNLNDFHRRYAAHRLQAEPAFERFQQLRHEVLAAEKERLALAQFQARPLPTFVRNRLVNDVYLPIVGDNLAKQIGAAGDATRTDRMGLLLLISPPGYGKTTLLEYVADRLGLIFVRINCPALGHGVTSLDPATAPNSAARQELEKLNLGLAMGSNVLLCLDDIQHTAPEFLQKFIGLADGTRRIEGVWNGQARTWDLRGKRFAIAMAGNPYTESGEVFRIPDMLANRSDIYNLGDVLAGREPLFALSYLENCLTSNPALQPLAARDPQDVHRLVRLAEGEAVAASDFSHDYGAAELEELKQLMQRLFRARDLLLKVNAAYIASAAQRDQYRTEPPFKLQGSYRNMTRLAARITGQMSEAELDALLRDHYRGEAQTLTTGAEENLLKLAHLMGTATAAEQARWRAICDDFVRRRKAGGDDADGSTRIASALLDVSRAVDALKPDPEQSEGKAMADAVLQLAVTYRTIIMPLITATEKRLDLDEEMRDRISKMMALQLDPRVRPAAPKKKE